jgi:hypothetical protein
MKRIIAATIVLVLSVLFAAAQPAKDSYAPGLGEFMTATQLRHAKIDEIKECLEDAQKQFPTRDGIPIADMIKTIIGPAIEGLEKAVGAKSSAKFTVAFDQLTSACNTCHVGANKPFIRIQRPTESPLSNQNFAPRK